ncbi:MAG: GTP-binding protein [Candidatus Thorarchaeota archaeon]
MLLRGLRGSNRVTRILKQGKGFKGVYKIVVIGSTGAGKTTLLKCLLGDLFKPTGEQKRRTDVENQLDATHTWYRVGGETTGTIDSTTTVSVNTAGILLVRTLYNSIEFHSLASADELILRDDVDSIFQLVFFDTAGQERFDFIPEMTLRGADVAIIIADGTNISSIEKIGYFVEITQREEERSPDRIPIIVMLNKKDLAKYGAFIGLEAVKRILDHDNYFDFHETSALSGEGIGDSVHSLMSRLHEKTIGK